MALVHCGARMAGLGKAGIFGDSTHLRNLFRKVGCFFMFYLFTMCIYANIYIYIHMIIYVYIMIYIYTYTYTYTHIYVHIYI